MVLQEIRDRVTLSGIVGQHVTLNGMSKSGWSSAHFTSEAPSPNYISSSPLVISKLLGPLALTEQSQ